MVKNKSYVCSVAQTAYVKQGKTEKMISGIFQGLKHDLHHFQFIFSTCNKNVCRMTGAEGFPVPQVYRGKMHKASRTQPTQVQSLHYKNIRAKIRLSQL